MTSSINGNSELMAQTLKGPTSAFHGSGAKDSRTESHDTIIVNADDWGRDVENTDRTLECVLQGRVSSVSAMLFMEDSERAAELARKHSVDAGVHLNLTSSFSAKQCSLRLAMHQQKLAHFLRKSRLSPVVYHPGLASSFEYVTKTQFEEFERLYGAPAHRVDGHHHMHLCANMFFQKLLPKGTIVRRNFSFGPGEKSYLNRLYRRWQDRGLERRHRMTDLFFSLPPLVPRARLQRVFDLSTRFSVEVETHPVVPDEYKFLLSEELLEVAGKTKIASSYTLHPQQRSADGAPA